MQDGRRSAAYMSLLHTAWKLKREHPKLQIIAMDSPGTTSAAERDKYMADQIRNILDEDKRYTVVAFAGNVHARRQKGTSWNKEFVPAGYFLRDVDSVSLNMDYTAGTAWNCNDAGCGVHPVSKAPASGKASIPRIELTQDDPNYDGQFVLGEITASLPVRQAKQK